MRFRKSLVALALQALAPASPAIAAPLDHAGLVGWWTFDDGGGTTGVIDASGNGNHGEELFPPRTTCHAGARGLCRYALSFGNHEQSCAGPGRRPP